MAFIESSKSSVVGNAAKMFEALVIARKAICNHAKYICQSLSWENRNIQSNCQDVLCPHRELCDAKTAINAALSAKTRNCDVLSKDEVLKMLEDRSFSKEDTIEWHYEEAKGGAK